MAIIKQVSGSHDRSTIWMLIFAPPQVQTIEADSKCQELWELLQWTRRQENTTVRDIIAYRREAGQHVGSDENLYRIEWVCLISVDMGVSWSKFTLWLQDSQLKALKIQLIGEEDPSVDEDDGGMGRWREYVASYVTKHPTEWVATLDGKKLNGGEPFLSRYVVVAAL